MYAVVRIRGKGGTNEKIEDTLSMLNLKNKFNCTLIPENDSHEGMLKKVENFVAWGEVEKKTAKMLLSETGMEDVDEVLDGSGINTSISLSPPSGGFKGSTKELYPDGEAGYRGEDINELLKRMI